MPEDWSRILRTGFETADRRTPLTRKDAPTAPRPRSPADQIGTGPVRGPSRAARVVPYALAAIFFTVYAAYATNEHRHLRTTGFDLGIFEQAVRGYANVGLPLSHLKGPGFNLLGDHFHPILALLAPVYRLVPSPVTLLVAQAALLAWSAVPVSRAAIRHLGTTAGALVGVAYGLSFGLQEAVAFDFHEVCFAVPLLALALERVMLRRWGAAALWTLPLLLVKEELAATVAAIGVVLFTYGQRRLGAGLAALGTATLVLVVTVVIPAANPAHTYGYWNSFTSGDRGGTGSLVAALTNAPVHLVTRGYDVKAATLLTLLAPTLLLALRSRLLLVAAPTLLWRFASDHPGYWGTGAHCSAVLMPTVFLAFVDALPRLRASLLPALRGLARVAVPACLAVTVALAVNRPLGELLIPATWAHSPRVAAVKQLLDRIPDGASVAASNRLVPQLTSRCDVYLVPEFRSHGAWPDWIVVDLHDEFPVPTAVLERHVTELTLLGYWAVARTGNVVLLRR